jgi:Coenzyme PQQ synthesis protein D (PqqD)
MQKMPQARKTGLIVKEVDGEILIYDQERNQAHCLNPTAAKIWKYCDGETTLAAACQSLSRDLDTRIDETLVRYAVDQFATDHLLETEAGIPAFMIPGLNRRQMVRRLGLAAAVAVPIVTSIIAPTPAQAATCLPQGASCTDSQQCCDGLCDGNNECA